MNFIDQIISQSPYLQIFITHILISFPFISQKQAKSYFDVWQMNFFYPKKKIYFIASPFNAKAD
jgi:hypothetical protein